MQNVFLQLLHSDSLQMDWIKFDEAYEGGLIDGVLTTNLIYQTPELLSRPYYINCDMVNMLLL